MKKKPAIAVVGTFDSKGEEHLFLKHRIEKTGISTLTVKNRIVMDAMKTMEVII